MLPSAAKMRRAALAEALVAEGVEVFRPDSEPRGWPGSSAYSDSHILAVDARSVGDGMSAAKALERVNILASPIDLPANKTGTNRSRFEQSASGGLPGLRLGVHELTRRAMTEPEMRQLAVLIADALMTRRQLELGG